MDTQNIFNGKIFLFRDIMDIPEESSIRYSLFTKVANRIHRLDIMNHSRILRYSDEITTKFYILTDYLQFNLEILNFHRPCNNDYKMINFKDNQIYVCGYQLIKFQEIIRIRDFKYNGNFAKVFIYPINYNIFNDYKYIPYVDKDLGDLGLMSIISRIAKDYRYKKAKLIADTEIEKDKRIADTEIYKKNIEIIELKEEIEDLNNLISKLKLELRI